MFLSFLTDDFYICVYLSDELRENYCFKKSYLKKNFFFENYADDLFQTVHIMIHISFIINNLFSTKNFKKYKNVCATCPSARCIMLLFKSRQDKNKIIRLHMFNYR